MTDDGDVWLVSCCGQGMGSVASASSVLSLPRLIVFPVLCFYLAHVLLRCAQLLFHVPAN